MATEPSLDLEAIHNRALSDGMDLAKRERLYIPPDSLGKAMGDSFQYALQLRTGDIIEFEEAELVNDEWVHLRGVEMYRHREHPDAREFTYIFERGMDVRLGDIVWVADAPYGS